MNNQVTIAQLQQMKLKGMAEYYQSMETLSPENRPTLYAQAALGTTL